MIFGPRGLVAIRLVGRRRRAWIRGGPDEVRGVSRRGPVALRCVRPPLLGGVYRIRWGCALRPMFRPRPELVFRALLAVSWNCDPYDRHNLKGNS